MQKVGAKSGAVLLAFPNPDENSGVRVCGSVQNRVQQTNQISAT
jgi:hypothetical protein